MRYASMRSMDISNGEGVGVSLFTSTVKIVLTLIHGISLAVKNGLVRQRTSLWDWRIPHILSEYHYSAANH